MSRNKNRTIKKNRLSCQNLKIFESEPLWRSNSGPGRLVILGQQFYPRFDRADFTNQLTGTESRRC